MNNKISKAAALAALTMLAGCASVPAFNVSPANIGLSAVKHNAALVSTTVTVAGKGEATGRIYPGTETGIVPLWKTALEDSLVRMAMFRDDAPMRLSLVVKILRFEIPGAGITMITHTAARYELIDRNTGAVVYATEINTDGRSPAGDNFMASIRARISAANSIQNNIADFLKQLESADLTKPMFPAQKQSQAGAAK